jgi:pimeloyl-ACP methyl ester carboxylesterase
LQGIAYDDFDNRFEKIKSIKMKKIKCIIMSTIITGSIALQGNEVNAQDATLNKIQASESIRPFKVHFAESEINDLRKRIKATRWPDRETVKNETQGVQLATMQALANYWGNNYDFNKLESKLNAYPQFITTIDGLDIHFIHVRSKHKNALPIIITHGWPGSFIEQMKIIGPLTDPTAYGGKAEDAFDVVIPSLPGYGFSGKPTEGGWNVVRVAKAWITLMKRLGYNKFVAQGGDWGNAVSETMALMAPPELLGIHTNMPATVPAEISKALAVGKMPEGLSPDEQNAFKQLGLFFGKGLGYAIEMNNKPQTLYGISDSPIGLAGWILDHDVDSYLLIARVFGGQQEGLTRDDILDNITMYWLTYTEISSARLYWETAQISNGGGFFDPRNVQIPVAVTVFPNEIYAAPKNWAQSAYPKLIYFNRVAKGGHFAAWEQPKVFSEELRAAFKSLR